MKEILYYLATQIEKTPGVDMTTGSLGQGISVSAGITYGLKQDQCSQYVYVIMGDGELNEGQCWEVFQFIAHYNLNNLIIFIDNNKKTPIVKSS